MHYQSCTVISNIIELIEQALIPKLRDQDPNVVISVLAAIGEHAQVSFNVQENGKENVQCLVNASVYSFLDNPGLLNIIKFVMHQVSGTEMSKWLNELCPIILDMLQDASLIAKREVSERSLGMEGDAL